jgi:hypothetical protein
MHLHDLLGDGEAEASAALGFGVGAIHLMELIEDAGLMLFGNTWARIRNADGEVAVHRFRGHVHLSTVRKLDRIADEVEEHLGKALFVTDTNGKRLGYFCPERELLVLPERLGGRTHGLDNALDGVFGHVQGELAERPKRCLPLLRIRVRASKDFGPCGS